MPVPFVQIQKLNFNYSKNWVIRDLDWTIGCEENWLLSGESGSGKTTLCKQIAEKYATQPPIQINFKNNINLPKQIYFVESWYQFKNIEGIANFYYQQRYTSQQAKDTVTVQKEFQLFGDEHQLSLTFLHEIIAAFNFEKLLNVQLLSLSSGEHKKLQLIKAIWLSPQLLILDQPYNGLDKASRQTLNNLLNTICDNRVQLILVSNDGFPDCINRFAEINNGKIYTSDKAYQPTFNHISYSTKTPNFVHTFEEKAITSIAKLENVNVSYGDKKVLTDINWEINAGEKWSLQGPNGSGKSTLLSLLNGDHPQAYANTIYLFGNKRGSGESIWDIKKNIGLISPEFHWYYDANATVWESVASGLYDSVGLFNQLPYSKSIIVDEYISFFDLLADKCALLSTLPLGKQRLVLLARTMIKNPALLILDEPCQGLDQIQIKKFNHYIDVLCHPQMTMIYVGHVDAHLPHCLQKKIVLEEGKVASIEDFNQKIIEKTAVYQ